MRYFILLFFCSCAGFVTAQSTPPDSAKRVPVNILNSGYGVQVITDSGEMIRLVDDVELEHEGTLMYCDSAYINALSDFVEAFGNVYIEQPGGTRVWSNYLRYTGASRRAFLKGDVVLMDEKDKLWCESLHYDMAARVGRYEEGGTLVSDSTTVTSYQGTYWVQTKDSRFQKDVFVSDPEYNVESEDLSYNTNTRIVQFFGPSIVINDRSELRTSLGTWESIPEKGFFPSRSSIRNEAQFIEADTIDYDRVTGFGYAYGNVIALDTAEESTLYSGYAEYNELTGVLRAMIRPVMKKRNGSDSLYIRADTFYSAPLPVDKITVYDTLSGAPLAAADSAVTGLVQQTRKGSDTSATRFFIGYHGVRIFSDSMQGSCDSIYYSQADSVMRMISDPVLWSRNSQITGDTIFLYTDSSELKELYIPNKALVVSVSGPEKAGMFDQIQGRRLRGYFSGNAIRQMHVWPDAESIYYATDEEDAYLGVSQSKSEEMQVFFRDQKIIRILLERDVDHSMTPLEEADIPALRLSRYRWLPERRPKTLEELFR